MPGSVRAAESDLLIGSSSCFRGSLESSSWLDFFWLLSITARERVPLRLLNKKRRAKDEHHFQLLVGSANRLGNTKRLPFQNETFWAVDRD
jgi:hypothetical protein